MSWQDEKVIIEINEENGKKLFDLELTKSQFVNANVLASEEGITVEEFVLRSITESLEGDSDEQ